MKKQQRNVPEKPKVFFLCDGRACGSDCPNIRCRYTSNIDHAINFKKIGTAYVEVSKEAPLSK